MRLDRLIPTCLFVSLLVGAALRGDSTPPATTSLPATQPAPPARPFRIATNKKRWNLWVRYADTEDDSDKLVVKRPIAAYVEKVDDLPGFRGLGL